MSVTLGRFYVGRCPAAIMPRSAASAPIGCFSIMAAVGNLLRAPYLVSRSAAQAYAAFAPTTASFSARTQAERLCWIGTNTCAWTDQEGSSGGVPTTWFKSARARELRRLLVRDWWGWVRSIIAHRCIHAMHALTLNDLVYIDNELPVVLSFLQCNFHNFFFYFFFVCSMTVLVITNLYKKYSFKTKFFYYILLGNLLLLKTWILAYTFYLLNKLDRWITL